MDDTIKALIQEAADGSSAGRLHFGQVIDLLLQAGVESYVADYRSRRTTYYLPEGEPVAIDLEIPDQPIAQDFNAPALKAAIWGSQRGVVKYPEFKRLSQAAGCVGYTVWIAGRHVTYCGRRGETHIEPFPT